MEQIRSVTPLPVLFQTALPWQVMSTDRPPERRAVGRPRSAGTHDRTLAGVLVVFAANGLHGLTIDRVAAEARAGKASIYRRWPDTATLLGDALQGVLVEWRQIDSLPQLADELGTDLGRGMLALALTAGLPLPLRSAVRLTVETLEQLLVRLPGEDGSFRPEQQLGLLIARQLLRERDPQL